MQPRITLKILLIALAAFACLLGSATASAEDGDFTQAELEQLLAPVALYPDAVLSHILIAATYPLDVVQAERWVQANRDLAGEDAVAAVEDKGWDPSVQALVAFPEIIVRMSSNLDWTEQLGQAFLADEAAVLAGIQSLRQRAYAAGNLDSLEHVRVTRDARTIVIEPAVREVVYIPYYDTRVIYGDWHWHNHPPVFWSFSSHRPHHGSHFFWSAGIHLRPAFYFSSFHWDHHQVVVVDHHRRPNYYSSGHVSRHRDARRWHHNPRQQTRIQPVRALRDHREIMEGRSRDDHAAHIRRPEHRQVQVDGPRLGGRPDHVVRSRGELQEHPPRYGRHPRASERRTTPPRERHESRRQLPSERSRSVHQPRPSHKLMRTMP